MELPPDLVSGTSVTAMFGAALVFIGQVIKAVLDRRTTPAERAADWSTINVRLDAENKGLLARIRAAQDRNDELQDRNDELQRQIDEERDAHRAELLAMRQQLDSMADEHRRQIETLAAEHRSQIEAMSRQLAAYEERYRRDD